MLLFIYGKTGSGKDYTSRALGKRYGYPQISRPTSRARRKTESQNSTYDFLSRQEFKEKVENKEIIFPSTFRDDYDYGVYFSTLVKALRDKSTTYTMTGDKGLAMSLLAFADEVEAEKEIFFLEVIAPKEDREFRAMMRDSSNTEALFEVKRRMDSDDRDYAKIVFIPDFEIGSFGDVPSYYETLNDIAEDIAFAVGGHNVNI